MKDKILELFKLWGDTISEEEIWRTYPGQRKDLIQALRELFIEGKIYPEITDFGKYEQNWVRRDKDES